MRIIEATKPRVAIAENVKNLTSKKFAEQFKIVLESLEAAGYVNYYKVLNAKDFGIPQNRERVFIVSIRKDIDNGTFQFPEGYPLKLRLKDMLEDEADEKFYLKDTANYFAKHSFDMERKGNGFRFEPPVHNNANIAKTITTRAGSRMDDNFVADIESDSNTFRFDSTNKDIEVFDLYNGRQIDSDVCGTITTGCSRNASGTFLVKEATKKAMPKRLKVTRLTLNSPTAKQDVAELVTEWHRL